jgi:hypothetical protein
MTEGLDAGGHEWEGVSTRAKDRLVTSNAFADWVAVKALDFDTVLISKGVAIPISVFQRLTELCDTTYWTPDSVGGNGCGPPARPEEVGARGLLCTRIICTGTEGARWYRQQGYEGRLAQIYQGCRHRIWKRGKYPRKSQSRLVFLGSPHYNGDGGRKEKFQAIEQAGYSMYLGRRIFHEKAADAYWNSAICPNFVCGDITSNRVMRILSSGGFCLTERNADIDHSFTDEVELAKFDRNNIPHMLDRIRYFMDNPKMRDEIAMQGHEWTRNKGWDQQMDKMVRFIGGEDIPADGAAGEYVSYEDSAKASPISADKDPSEKKE